MMERVGHPPKERKAAEKNGEHFNNGSMYHYEKDGTKIVDGSYRQIDTDLNSYAQGVLSQPVINNARGATEFLLRRTIDFMTIFGPSVLSEAAPAYTSVVNAFDKVTPSIHAAEQMTRKGITQQAVDYAVESAQRAGRVATGQSKYGTTTVVYEGTNGVTVVVETAGRNAGKAATVHWGPRR
jgi:hypothetical protein